MGCGSSKAAEVSEPSNPSLQAPGASESGAEKNDATQEQQLGFDTDADACKPLSKNSQPNLNRQINGTSQTAGQTISNVRVVDGGYHGQRMLGEREGWLQPTDNNAHAYFLSKLNKHQSSINQPQKKQNELLLLSQSADSNGPPNNTAEAQPMKAAQSATSEAPVLQSDDV